jgi:hypothetical protein
MAEHAKRHIHLFDKVGIGLLLFGGHFGGHLGGHGVSF